MSQISRIKTWTAEVLYSADLNAEFNNVVNFWNGADLGSTPWTSLAVTNNATIGGTLSVTGTTTLGVVNISGTGTIGTLAVTGNGTVTGTFNVTGAVNFSSTLGVVGAISIAATSNQFIIGSARTVTISAPTPASASRVWTIPDISTDGTFASLTGTQTFSGAKTFSDALTVSGGINGTTTNDNASAGKVGEYKETISGGSVSLTTAQYSDGGNAGISLTAGDWDVWATAVFVPAATTNIRELTVFVGTAPGNNAANLDEAKNTFNSAYDSAGIVNGGLSMVFHTPTTRISLSGTTTYYPKSFALFTVSTMTSANAIFARRVR